MSDLSDQINDNAQAPKQVTADGVTAQQHSLPEQIAADRYLKSQAGVGKRNRGLRLSKLKPPGTA